MIKLFGRNGMFRRSDFDGPVIWFIIGILAGTYIGGYLTEMTWVSGGKAAQYCASHTQGDGDENS